MDHMSNRPARGQPPGGCIGGTLLLLALGWLLNLIMDATPVAMEIVR